jgi:hypothetical protein
MTRRQRTCVVRTAGACCVGPGGLLLLCATPTTCGAPCFVLCALQRPRPPGPCSGAPQFASCLPIDGFSTPLATWRLVCGRGPPSQVSAGAGLALHGCVAIMSMPPLEPPSAVVCYPLRCRCCARAGAAATDRGYRNSNIYLATRTWGHRASSTRRPRATALPPGKWQVCVATPETMRGLWCPQCACVSRCGQPPPLSGSQDPLYLRSPLRLWLPSEVLRRRVVADGPGCTRHQPQEGHCFPCGHQCSPCPNP